MVEIKQKRTDGIGIIQLKNENILVDVTNYGCTILRMMVKDKKGGWTDTVLGFPTLEDYAKKDGTYLGALVGRVANRIKRGHFTLNSKEYQLAINNGPNSLHGGLDGFSYKIFEYELLEDAVRFHYISKDGEENYPGNLDFYATYSLKKNGLKIEYEAESDQDTIINITNHSYFNLNGIPSNIENHFLKISANQVGCIDQDGLFNGIIRNVENTPFDFRKATLIQDKIYNKDEQLTIGKGYDHTFIFNTKKNQVCLYSPKTGIELKVSTTLPQAQIYSANYLEGQKNRDGNLMQARDALCIETQNLPDSINQEKNPSVLLKKGDKYKESTVYQFEVRK